MKCLPAVTAGVVFGLAACDTMTRPLSSSGDFDPLRPPGSTTTMVSTQGPAFSAGQMVRSSMDNTAFFKTKPKGDSDADKLLKQNTSMKVIFTSGSYVKVELDSGEIGFVPTLMVEDPSAAPQIPVTGPGTYQVYPPLPSGGVSEPLPPLDPAGLPPEGAIPTIIDPEAPVKVVPLPPVTPTNDTFPTPAEAPDPTPPIEPKVESTPLPPNGEEKSR